MYLYTRICAGVFARKPNVDGVLQGPPGDSRV
jgi:hypothetical protein